MPRKSCSHLAPLFGVFFVLCLLFVICYRPAWAAPLRQDDGQGYIVQAGDSLYKISGQFYGKPNAYAIIIEATNTKAATDARFTHITDPRRIRAGQRLWIPNSAELPIIAQAAAPVAQPQAVQPSVAQSATTAVPTVRSVRFVSPATGANVSPTVAIVMTATGLTVEPSGEIRAGAGHFHILVDSDFVPAGDVIITDLQHLHFGKGQITTTLELAPGEHVLRLQFANGAHIALEGEEYQDTITATVAGQSSAAPSVRFVRPLDQATVPLTFTAVMTATGLAIEPAGAINAGAGHFHILVDTDFVPAGDVIITDPQHLHFGKGQITTPLTLEPGEHVLRLQFANGAHIALEGEAYQDTITVTVGEATAEATSAAPSVRFVEPLDNATVPPKLAVTMAATGLIVEPSGEIRKGAGHFHILVDTDFVPAGDVIITDEQHLHFGKGQITTTLELAPGEHVLRLQFANGAHIALEGEEYQATITVTVAETASVRFVRPLDQATVPLTFTAVMTATGLAIEPAGAINPGAGHFHILVDTDFVPAGDVIITDEQHLHFGKGQVETTLSLRPGTHILRLQFANGAHIALEGEEYQDEITVNAK